ncbi:hypothetical protein SLA2020_205460 [Shorea laevis]
MGTAKWVRGSALIICVLFFAFSIPSSVASAKELSLAAGDSNATLQLSPALQVQNCPGLKPGVRAICERVYIHGLSRLRNLNKFAHSVKVTVSQVKSSALKPNVEICIHRNMSLGIGMCPQGKWEKVSKGSWIEPMSPFGLKVLDIRMISSSIETLEVSIIEEFYVYRVLFLIVGIILLSSATFLSKSLAFYYSSAMAVGVILVVLLVLFQGMKLLPTGRTSSLAIFIYSSMVGLGSFLLRYLPSLLQSVLAEIGISEDMYNPLANFLLAFIVLAGAWLGFWAVRKLVLTEDGSVDISTSNFVAWSIWIFAVTMILQSSSDPLLALEALVSSIMVSKVLQRTTQLRFLRRLYKKLFKFVKNIWRSSEIPDFSLSQNPYDEYIYKIPYESKFLQHQFKRSNLASRSSPVQGITTTSTSRLSDMDSYPSTFHMTPDRRKFTKEEFEKFTRESTEKAVDELVSSPDFSKWVAANADRITVTPGKSPASVSSQPRRWLLWF